MPIWTPVKRSGMHHKHLVLGAAMVERDGWQQPARYTAVEAELRRLKESVGICDISPDCKLTLKGDHIDQLLSGAFINASGIAIGDVRRVGEISNSAAHNVVLARLASDEALMLGPAGQVPPLTEILVENPATCAHVVDITSGLAGVGIIGPKAGLVLGAISELDTSAQAFPDMRCAQSKFADIHGALLRLDHGGVPGYRLYFGREFGEYMWDVIMEAAQRYGGAPVGIEAMERLSG